MPSDKPSVRELIEAAFREGFREGHAAASADHNQWESWDENGAWLECAAFKKLASMEAEQAAPEPDVGPHRSISRCPDGKCGVCGWCRRKFAPDVEALEKVQRYDLDGSQLYEDGCGSLVRYDDILAALGKPAAPPAREGQAAQEGCCAWKQKDHHYETACGRFHGMKVSDTRCACGLPIRLEGGDHA